MMTVSVSHEDTCLACYVTDHHNRDGEVLLGVPVDGSSTNLEVMQYLIEEIGAADFGLPDDFDYAAFDEAVMAEFDGRDGDKPFDTSLESVADGDDDEMVQAWFLVTWRGDGED